MPEGFESGRNHDADMSSDGQIELEEKLDISLLTQVLVLGMEYWMQMTRNL